jgi:hypothetical protein
MNDNSENRNNMNTIHTPRVNILRNIARNRRCSFCRDPNHTINFCHDIRLENFKILCEFQKSIFESEENSSNQFKEWLMSYYLENPENQHILKAFAIRNCRTTTRTRIPEIIDSIMDYYYGIYYDLPRLIPIETEEFIPFPAILNDINNITNDSEFLMEIIDYLQSSNFISHQPRYQTEIEIEVEETEMFKNITPNCDCDCDICYNSFDTQQFVKLKCSHEFCKECIKGILKSSDLIEGPKCAFCRTKITTLICKSHDIKEDIYHVISNAIM